MIELHIRSIIPIFLYMGAVTPAPQDSSITFIKPQPLINDGPSIAQPISSYRESRIENIPLTLPNINTEADDDARQVRSDSTTEIANTEIMSTEGTEVEFRTEENELTKPPPAPRFYSKLSYFQKPDARSALRNLVERGGKRKFRSKCRCERISNCPKLQISVPRCPEEYFMCCF